MSWNKIFEVKKVGLVNLTFCVQDTAESKFSNFVIKYIGEIKN